MKKTALLLGFGTLIMAGGILTSLNLNHMDSQATSTSSESHPHRSNVEINNHIHIHPNASISDGIYSDSSRNIQELKKKSDLIVLGEVAAQEKPNPLVLSSSVQVEKQWPGKKKLETIIVHQLTPEPLEIGDKAYLFLSKQEDGKHNSYYITGGRDGIFYVEDGRIEGRVAHLTNDLYSTLLRKSSNMSIEEQVARFEEWLNRR